MKMHKVYALYKGDALVCTGTIYEIAERLQIRPDSVSYMSTQAYARKAAKCKTSKNRQFLIPIDETAEAQQIPKETGGGAHALQEKAQTRNRLRQQQKTNTALMLKNMETLDHIPQRMRYAYENYRNALAQGHAYACRYMIDGQMND